MTEMEIWTKWESQIVNGLFPLRRFLGRSNHSVVFLTEYKAQKAAIKLLPPDPATADAQLSHWQRIAALSHPNLIRIFDTGRCKLGGHPFLFLVMEYAEQTLAQILPHRALSGDEARDMLRPSLDALAYLHGQNLVQAQLKPANFLVVNDRLRLASDTIRSVGERWPSETRSTIYDAPETPTSGFDTAGDIWGLGVVLVESLTQRAPERNDPQELRLPGGIPSEFLGSLRGCLSHDPAARPTLSQLQARFFAPPAAAAPSAEAPAAAQVVSPSVAAVPSVHTLARARWLMPAAAVGLVILLAVWAAKRPLAGGDGRAPRANIAASSPQPSEQAPLSSSAAAIHSAVIHEEIPRVARGVRDSIRSEIRVAVLVTVDHSGIVVAEVPESRGPSKYFARVAAAAAKKWRFAPADAPALRQWSLLFEFNRGGATAQAAPRETVGQTP